MAATSLSHLPNELALLISTHLPPRSLNCLMLTAKGFAYLLDPLLYTKAVTHKCENGLAVVVWAAREGRLSVVEKILQRAGDSIPYKDRFLALYRASERGHEDIVRCLLATIPDADPPEIRCIAHEDPVAVIELLVAGLSEYVDVVSTALHAAARAGHANVVQLLLDSGVALKPDSPALSVAAVCGHEAVVRALLAAGMAAFPDAISYALRSAAHRGHAPLVKLLVESHSPHGPPPFQALKDALTAGNEEVVQVMLSAEDGLSDEAVMRAVSSAARRGKTGMVRVLLHFLTRPVSQSWLIRVLENTIRCGNEEIVRLLMTVETDNPTDEFVPAVLHAAVATGRVDILRFLLGAGSDATNGVRYFESLLFVAVHRGCTAVVELLLGRGAAINSRDCQGRTPLHEAAYCGNPEILRLLLQPGIDISARTIRGETALHCAAVHGFTLIAKELVSYGIELSAGDNRQLTALHLAAKKGHEEFVQLLVSSGADVSTQSCAGWTPLDLAARREHKSVVRTLLSASGVDASDGNIQFVIASVMQKSTLDTKRVTSPPV